MVTLMLTPERFATVLQNHGLKATERRMAIHNAMLDLGHACAEDVSKYVQTKLGINITAVSVYTNLSRFADLGIYSRCLSFDSRMYFDANPSKHINLYDTVNGQFKDIESPKTLELVENQFKGRRFRGYSIDGIAVQVLCHSTSRTARKKKM